MKFKKKPVVVDAAPIREICASAQSDWSALPEWVKAHYEKGDIIFLHDGIIVSTLEGKLRGDIDSILIQGVAGEIYAIKPDIFAATYEPVE